MAAWSQTARSRLCVSERTADEARKAAARSRLGGVTVEADNDALAMRPDGSGGTHYEWVSGRDVGYGFTASPTPSDMSLDAHRECIRGFLAQIDSATGFIADD